MMGTVGGVFTVESPLPECESGRYWEVRPGDTVYLIATELGVSPGEILQLNPGIDPDNLQVGSILCLPRPAGIPIGPVPPCASGLYWAVASGDTLFTIAEATSTTVRVLMELNPHVDPLNLQVGMSICLPGIS
jgi:LysM repeat protein